MNILSFLPWRKAAPPRGCRRSQEIEVLPCEDDERPLGCGWFDSSHDLQHGLQVREHASADAVANDLPVALWLEIKLQPRPS